MDIKETQTLFVEGKDDRIAIEKICQACQIPDNFKIEEAGGIVKLLELLKVYLKTDKHTTRTVGLVLDGDTNPQGRWKQIEGITPHGYSLPPKPGPPGTIMRKAGKVTIGLWIMPNN